MRKSLKEIWYSDEYKVLREKLGDRLCFICYGGSYAYGTNIETSDIDIRGVCLPNTDELIGLNKFYQEEQKDEDTDVVIYEFSKFVKLAMDGNPNVLELLGCREYLIFNEVGFTLLNNAENFLSKKCILTFCGYATSQLRRLENFLAETEYTQEEKNKYIKQTMEVAMNKLSDKNKLFAEGAIKVNLDKDNNLTMDCDVKNAPLDLVRASLNDLLTIERTYNKLGQRNTKKDELHLNKHIMHLVRLYLTCFDILDKHRIRTYREKDKDLLLEIRKGKFLKNNKLTDDFRPYLESLEKKMQELKEITTLPEKPKFKELNKLVSEINKKVVDNNIQRYQEPLVYDILYKD